MPESLLNRDGQQNFPSEPDFHRFFHQAGPQSVNMEIEMSLDCAPDGIPFSPRQVSKFSIRPTFSIRKFAGEGEQMEKQMEKCWCLMEKSHHLKFRTARIFPSGAKHFSI